MAKKSHPKVFGLLNEIKHIPNNDLSDFITIDEASDLLKLKKSYLYKLVCIRRIPFYKPNGKILYFKKSELFKWIEDSKSFTVDEVAEKLKERSI